MAQSVVEGLVAATRETADGAAVAVVFRAVVLLDVGHQVVHEVQAERIAAKLRRGCSSCLGSLCRHQLQRIAVGQHHNHLLRLLVGKEVVQDVVHASHLVVHLLRVRRAADEVEHRVALLHVLHVVGRQIDDGVVRGADGLRIVMDVLHASVRHLPDVVRQLATARNLQQAVLEPLVGEVLRIHRVHHAHAVHHVAVRIHVGSRRAQRHAPRAIFAPRHLLAAGKLHVHQHRLRRVVLILESHRPVSIRTRLCTGNGSYAQQCK